MPNYITRASLAATIPPQFVLEALDDNADGVEDVGLFDEVLANAQREVNGTLGKRYKTPFSNPIPDIVANATLIFVAEALYSRRGYGSESKPNPFASRAKAIRADLAAIAAGTVPLTPETKREKPSASVISEPSKTTSATAGKSSI